MSPAAEVELSTRIERDRDRRAADKRELHRLEWIARENGQQQIADELLAQQLEMEAAQ